MRAAWPSVSGRCRASICRTSNDSAAHRGVVERRPAGRRRSACAAALDLARSACRCSRRTRAESRCCSITGRPAAGRARRAVFHVKHRSGRAAPARRRSSKPTPGRRSRSTSAVLAAQLRQAARRRPAAGPTQVACSRAVSRETSSACARRPPSARRRPAPRRRPTSVRRTSALSSRSCSRYSARLVNIRYGSVTPLRHQVVDQHAEVGLVAPRHPGRVAAHLQAPR